MSARHNLTSMKSMGAKSLVCSQRPRCPAYVSRSSSICWARTERLDLITIPKAGNRTDVHAVDMLVTQFEAAMRTKSLSFQLMIETAQGLANIYEIAAASSRNDSLHLGQNDLAASRWPG
jgi:citrate lyase beta subunit